MTETYNVTNFPTAIIRVTDETTPEELRVAITELGVVAARLPRCWADRKAMVHERINALLDELDEAH